MIHTPELRVAAIHPQPDTTGLPARLGSLGVTYIGGVDPRHVLNALGSQPDTPESRRIEPLRLANVVFVEAGGGYHDGKLMDKQLADNLHNHGIASAYEHWLRDPSLRLSRLICGIAGHPQGEFADLVGGYYYSPAGERRDAQLEAIMRFAAAVLPLPPIENPASR